MIDVLFKKSGKWTVNTFLTLDVFARIVSRQKNICNSRKSLRRKSGKKTTRHAKTFFFLWRNGATDRMVYSLKLCHLKMKVRHIWFEELAKAEVSTYSTSIPSLKENNYLSFFDATQTSCCMQDLTRSVETRRRGRGRREGIFRNLDTQSAKAMKGKKCEEWYSILLKIVRKITLIWSAYHLYGKTGCFGGKSNGTVLSSAEKRNTFRGIPLFSFLPKWSKYHCTMCFLMKHAVCCPWFFTQSLPAFGKISNGTAHSRSVSFSKKSLVPFVGKFWLKIPYKW